MASQSFDILRATAHELRRMLERGHATSVDLVRAYLAQIAAHNRAGMKLNAVISVAPEDYLLEQARALDAERQRAGPRSRLHGIPILIKDQFCLPSFKLPTTAGTLALAGLEADEDAAIPVLLRKAGAIIIATTNLSELGNAKGYEIMAGWSPVGGQTQTPYVEGGVDPKGKWLGHTTPAGSSSGSAVGVAAGFAPWAIGTELDGSIIQPALRAALYALKPTPGTTDLRGTQAEGSVMVSIGGFAKSVRDLADLTTVLMEKEEGIFDPFLRASWEGISIAVLDPQVWHYPDSVCERNDAFDEQIKEDITNCLAKIASLGARVTYNAPLSTVEDLVNEHGTPEPFPLQLYETRITAERFFSHFDSPTLRTIENLIQFCLDHAESELPSTIQTYLEDVAKSHMPKREFIHNTKVLRTRMRTHVKNCLAATNADFIVATGESVLTTVAQISTYPIASLPVGFADFNGRPFGLEVIARDGEEDKLFQVMSAWEATFPDAVRPPTRLQGAL